MKQLVVMASGSGSNFQSIIDSIERGEIQANIAGLIVNRKEAGALDRAVSNNIPTHVLPGDHSETFREELESKLDEWNPDLIILAGFLKKIPDSVVKKYENRIINIHPSLLPKFGGKGFYGEHVHRAVLESGDSETGCTAHYVNEHYDEGDIIAQKKVSVQPDDTPKTLAKRVLKQEHKLLPAVIKQLLNQT